MHIDTTVKIGDILTAFGFLFTCITIVFAYRTLERNTRSSQLNFMLHAFNSITDDAPLAKLFYQIEYDKFRYSDGTFHGSELETLVDKLLGKMDNIARLRLLNQIEKKDFETVEYHFRRIYSNREIHKYFVFLDIWGQQIGLPIRKFDNFRKIGEKLMLEVAN